MADKKRLRDLLNTKKTRPEDPPSPPPEQFKGKTVREVEQQIEDNRGQENR